MKLIRNILLVLCLYFTRQELCAQGTVFTYQGSLTDNGAVANGKYDLSFTLFTVPVNGSAVSGAITNFATAVTNGLFAVDLDFGNVFNGSARWLEIAVRTNGSPGSMTILSPRQQLTPTPYATFAANSSNATIAMTISGTLPTGSLTGTYTNSLNLTSVSNSYYGTYNGNGIGLTNVPGGFLLWRIFNSANLQALANTGYILTNSFLTTVTLPAATNVSDGVRFVQSGTGSWKLYPRTNESILSAGLAGTVGRNWQPHADSGNWFAITGSSDLVKLAAVISTAGLIYTSSDSGLSWASHAVIGGAQNWNGIAMSADGVRIMACVNNGLLWQSSDSGTTWNSRDSGRLWTCIASSHDGSRLVAGVSGGKIYTSVDYGTNWVSRDSNRNWYSVASSGDGSKLAAVENPGKIYTSLNSGTNWFVRTIGLPISASWNSIASSSDGSKLVACAFNDKVYLSTDYGTNWSVINNSTNTWSSIAISEDGSKIAASVFNTNIWVSGDLGATWSTNSPSLGWKALISSSDGSKLAAAVLGGQIYTSIPTTSTSTTNYITGVKGSAIELLSDGVGHWIPVSSMGSIYTY